MSGQAVSNIILDNSGGDDNERAVRIVAQKALELELEYKESTTND